MRNTEKKHIFYVCHKLDSKQLHRLDRLDFLKQLHFLDSEIHFKRGSIYANALVDLRWGSHTGAFSLNVDIHKILR